MTPSRRICLLTFALAFALGAPLAPISLWDAGAADPTSQPDVTAAPRKLNPELLKLPANTWVQRKPDREPVGRSYSGVCYGDGAIFYFGGGHGSHPGNDVELYDVAANTWTQATEPEDWRQADQWTHITSEQKKKVKGIGGGWGVNILSPKGRPLTEHTYQMHAWFPEAKAFYNLLTPGTWAFDPAKREWTQICDAKSTPRGRDIHTWNLAYDPDLRTLVSIVSAGNNGVFVFDREKKSWSKKCGVPFNGWNQVYSTYDSARRRHVVYAGMKWWTLDTAAGKFTPIAPLGDAIQQARGLDKPPQLASLSIEFDPESKLTLVAVKGKGAELWAYDADKNAWSAVAMAGQPPRGATDFDVLVYDPDHKCFLFLNVLGVQSGAKTDGVYAFRFKRIEGGKS